MSNGSSGFIYLASPYTHPEAAVREARFAAACHAAAHLMKSGLAVFSPIAHSHHIDLCFAEPRHGPFWKAQDLPLLRHAAALKVLTLDGWLDSPGIQWEVELARSLHIPVTFMEPLKLQQEQKINDRR